MRDKFFLTASVDLIPADTVSFDSSAHTRDVAADLYTRTEQRTDTGPNLHSDCISDAVRITSTRLVLTLDLIMNWKWSPTELNVPYRVVARRNADADTDK